MAYIDPLDGITVFAAVAEAESFSGAARALTLSKAAVSTQIQRLEDRLGARLLNRTTRRVSLTDEGRSYLEHCRRILAEVREAEDSLDTGNAEPRGVLRINAPMSFGTLHLGGAVADFMAHHPLVEVDLVLNDRQIDLIEDGFDLGVRIAKLADSSLIARRIAPCRRVVVASPDYWDRHGRPAHPDNLKSHQALLYSYLDQPGNWAFREGDRSFTVEVSGRYRANNGEVLLDAAKRGLGMVFSPTFFCCDALRDESLEMVLADYEADPISVYAVYPHRRHLSARVRAFVDFLATRFGEAPYWDTWSNDG